MSTKIAIVIVSYNGREYYPDLFNSLKTQTLKPEQIVIVDNASTDGSVEYIKALMRQNNPPLSRQGGTTADARFYSFARSLPSLRFIQNRQNLGFAGANNQGIEEALKSEPDYIFLLNQDTIVDKNCLRELAKFFEQNKDKKIFTLQPLILCWPEKDKIQTSGDRIHFLGFGYSGDYRKQFNNITIKQLNKEIAYASGSAMFIDAKTLDEVGLFDKDLFLYHEDLDLSWRARLLGYNIILVPQAKVWHKYSPGISARRWYWSERGRQIVLVKLYRFPTLILIFPLWLVIEAGALFWSLAQGYFFFKIKSYFSALRQVPRTLWKRRKIQSERKISDRQIAEWLDGKFNFGGFTHPMLKYLVNPVFGFIWNILRHCIFW